VTSGADALIVQAVGAALIERHMDAVEDEIRAELAPGESLLTRYSPGYGDFPLEAQRSILALLDTPRKIGVSLTDSLLMVPSKSVSAVIGVRCCARGGSVL
jgi:cobalamin-dependent methionine synthase I